MIRNERSSDSKSGHDSARLKINHFDQANLKRSKSTSLPHRLINGLLVPVNESEKKLISNLNPKNSLLIQSGTSFRITYRRSEPISQQGAALIRPRHSIKRESHALISMNQLTPTSAENNSDRSMKKLIKMADNWSGKTRYNPTSLEENLKSPSESLKSNRNGFTNTPTKSQLNFFIKDFDTDKDLKFSLTKIQLNYNEAKKEKLSKQLDETSQSMIRVQ
jgi:hypothetical protein